jgi:hypothetical protein
MNTFIKKTFKYMLVAAVALVSLGTVAFAHAAPQFGVGGSPYLPLVQVQVCGVSGNGCNPSPSAYSTSISGVQPGDNVWVMMYYNNQGTGTAYGSKFTLSPQSTGIVNSQTFSGTLSATNASQVSGSATVGLSQGQTLTYYSAKLYAHNNVQIALPSGNGQDLFNGGLNIGDIHDASDCSSADTFCHQGVLVVTYKVGTTVVVPPPTNNCVINSFYATPTAVTSGNTSSLYWNTTNCTSVTVSGGGFYSSSLSGSQSTSPLYNTTSYTITAYGSGSPQTQTTTVSVNTVVQNNCYISYFSANPTWVTSGSSSTLSWATNGCTNVNISGPNLYSSSQPLSGSTSTSGIYNTSTYTLTATGQNGQTQTQSVTVTTQQQTSCYITSFYATPANVVSGGSTTLYWNTTGATAVSVSGLNNNYNNYYNQSLSGSQTTGAIYGTQTYTLTATCQNGQSQTQAITVSVNQPTQVTSVYTGAPNSVTQTSAHLNGVLSQSGTYSSQVYFQWGTTTGYGFTTNQQYAGSSSSAPFVDTITGLTSNTIYHYRAVATNSSGTFYGDDQSFSTIPVVVNVPPQVVTVVRTVGGSGSDLVSLDINNNQAINVCVGNIVNYLVTYKNISGHTLNNAVLQVLLPQDVDFQSSNPGIYNVADHTITLSIGTLAKDQTGTMNVTGTVLRTAINRNLIVASATIAFTNPVNASQESAIAYGLGNTNNCSNNSLAGLALFGDGFWPTTLIGWLFLILILLILIYLATLLFRNSRKTVVTTTTHAPYNPVMTGNGMMRNQAAPMGTTTTQHYEEMDIPTYNNH